MLRDEALPVTPNRALKCAAAGKGGACLLNRKLQPVQ